MSGYPQFSFWIPIALAKIGFSCMVKPDKNTSVLVGTVLKVTKYEVKAIVVPVYRRLAF